MDTDEFGNDLVLKVGTINPTDNIKILLLQYDCASEQWERALVFAVKNDQHNLLNEMINCMKEKNFSRNENCMALFDAVWNFKNESAKLLIPYSDMYMGVVASVEVNNTDAFNFLIDLLTRKEKTNLLDYAILFGHVQIVEEIVAQCDYQNILDWEIPVRKKSNACIQYGLEMETNG